MVTVARHEEEEDEPEPEPETELDDSDAFDLSKNRINDFIYFGPPIACTRQQQQQQQGSWRSMKEISRVQSPEFKSSESGKSEFNWKEDVVINVFVVIN